MLCFCRKMPAESAGLYTPSSSLLLERLSFNGTCAWVWSVTPTIAACCLDTSRFISLICYSAPDLGGRKGCGQDHVSRLCRIAASAAARLCGCSTDPPQPRVDVFARAIGDTQSACCPIWMRWKLTRRHEVEAHLKTHEQSAALLHRRLIEELQRQMQLDAAIPRRPRKAALLEAHLRG